VFILGTFFQKHLTSHLPRLLSKSERLDGTKFFNFFSLIVNTRNIVTEEAKKQKSALKELLQNLCLENGCIHRDSSKFICRKRRLSWWMMVQSKLKLTLLPMQVWTCKWLLRKARVRHAVLGGGTGRAAWA